MPKYAFTIKILQLPTWSEKKTLKDADERDYHRFLVAFYKLVHVDFIVGEVGKRGIFHFHGMMFVPKYFYFKAIYMRGFHFHYQKVVNKKGWEKYCYKNSILHCFETLDDCHVGILCIKKNKENIKPK